MLGCDGCGVIEATGEGVDHSWVGKKVAFMGGGWARYATKDVNMLVTFPDDFDLRSGANTIVNPLTVVALVSLAEQRRAKSVVILAASSSLAKQMIRFCRTRDIETVCIVRK